jgi:photosystem II stability/assembly factor-like uncharacterized protein
MSFRDAGCGRYVARTAAAALAAACVALPLAADNDSGTLPAESARLSTRSLLLDVAFAGSRLVAVGERGHILLSDNRGQTWQQARSVPTQNLLTAVCFLDERRGVAVGHDEIVLTTADAGETWIRTHYAPETRQPLLDVSCNVRDVIAVGAYSTYMVSTDAGATWSKRPFEAEPTQASGDTRVASGPAELAEGEELALDYHLNRIVAVSGSRLYIAGEAGHLYRSDDGGRTWRELPSPYEGSFFGVLPLEGESLLAYGLRGRLFRSEDGGFNWRPIETATTAMLTDAVKLIGDRIVIVGLSGVMLVSRDGGEHFTLLQQADRKGLSAVVATTPAEVIAVGETGVKRIAVEER